MGGVQGSKGTKTRSFFGELGCGIYYMIALEVKFFRMERRGGRKLNGIEDKMRWAWHVYCAGV